MNLDYNRYNLLKNSDGSIDMLPFIELPLNNSDKYERWKYGYSRLDKIANYYYGNPFYDFFILLANPSYISEYDIPDNTLIRIPFPIEKVKSDYENILIMLKKQ